MILGMETNHNTYLNTMLFADNQVIIEGKKKVRKLVICKHH